MPLIKYDKQGLDGTQRYLDDVLVTGSSEDEHLKNLEHKRLKQFGLRANRLKSSVTYLGYVLDTKGLDKSPDKVTAVQNALRPRDVSSLCSYIGLVNYYNRVLPVLATTLHLLYQLLEKGHRWK